MAECLAERPVDDLVPRGEHRAVATKPLPWMHGMGLPECLTLLATSTAVYADLLDLLSECVDPGRLRRFRLSETKQIRLDWLLEKNREGTLTEDESAELDDFECFAA